MWQTIISRSGRAPVSAVSLRSVRLFGILVVLPTIDGPGGVEKYVAGSIDASAARWWIRSVISCDNGRFLGSLVVVSLVTDPVGISAHRVALQCSGGLTTDSGFHRT